jgi:hypothetical protein
MDVNIVIPIASEFMHLSPNITSLVICRCQKIIHHNLALGGKGRNYNCCLRCLQIPSMRHLITYRAKIYSLYILYGAPFRLSKRHLHAHISLNHPVSCVILTLHSFILQKPFYLRALPLYITVAVYVAAVLIYLLVPAQYLVFRPSTELVLLPTLPSLYIYLLRTYQRIYY